MFVGVGCSAVIFDHLDNSAWVLEASRYVFSPCFVIQPTAVDAWATMIVASLKKSFLLQNFQFLEKNLKNPLYFGLSHLIYFGKRVPTVLMFDCQG